MACASAGVKGLEPMRLINSAACSSRKPTDHAPPVFCQIFDRLPGCELVAKKPGPVPWNRSMRQIGVNSASYLLRERVLGLSY